MKKDPTTLKDALEYILAARPGVPDRKIFETIFQIGAVSLWEIYQKQVMDTPTKDDAFAAMNKLNAEMNAIANKLLRDHHI